MGRKRGYDRWDEGPKETVGLGSLEVLANFSKAKKAQALYRPDEAKPGPIFTIQVINGEEVKTTMPKSMKNAPVEAEEVEELDEEEATETEEGEEDEDAPKAKRGNPGNLTPREPVKVKKDVFSAQTEEVQKLLKKREKYLAEGDQKKLRKIRALLRKAGFRLSSYAGSNDKIANAAKAKAKETANTKPSKKDDDDDDDD